MTGEVTEAPVGPPGAPVVTSRSNKRAGMAAEETEAPVGPPGAPISTTRSNIRRPGVAISASTVEAADAPAAAPFALDIGTTESLVLNAGGGNDTISTTRSIIRRPGVAISASNNERCEVGAERQEAPNGG